MKPSFAAEVFADDRRMAGVQAPVRALVDTVRRMPFADGASITIALAGGGIDPPIPHRLGRQPQGWFLTDQDAQAQMWRTAWDSSTITLDSNTAVTITFWVF